MIISHLLAPDLCRCSTFLSAVHFKLAYSTFSPSCTSQINGHPHSSKKNQNKKTKTLCFQTFSFIHFLFILSFFFQGIKVTSEESALIDGPEWVCLKEGGCCPAGNHTSCVAESHSPPPWLAQHLTLFLAALHRRLSFAQQGETCWSSKPFSPLQERSGLWLGFI